MTSSLVLSKRMLSFLQSIYRLYFTCKWGCIPLPYFPLDTEVVNDNIQKLKQSNNTTSNQKAHETTNFTCNKIIHFNDIFCVPLSETTMHQLTKKIFNDVGFLLLYFLIPQLAEVNIKSQEVFPEIKMYKSKCLLIPIESNA